jgi:predicted transcriptional regulator
MTQEDVLNYLKEHKGKSYTVMELSKALKTNKSGLYRMCGILARVNFIKKVVVKKRMKSNENRSTNCYIYNDNNILDNDN